MWGRVVSFAEPGDCARLLFAPLGAYFGLVIASGKIDTLGVTQHPSRQTDDYLKSPAEISRLHVHVTLCNLPTTFYGSNIGRSTLSEVMWAQSARRRGGSCAGLCGTLLRVMSGLLTMNRGPQNRR